MIARIPFGRTGHRSSRTIFGAAALAKATDAEDERALELVLEHDLNHIDTAASYGDSELRLARWLAREGRDRFFLATKTGERTYAAARGQIQRSLERLGVDHVDLIQLHNLVDTAEWETALGADGALRAAVEARAAGLVRFIGVTGHGLEAPRRHRESLERFDFDSVLFPYNTAQLADARYRADVDALVALCRARGVAMQTIKSVTLRPWTGDRPARPSTWYEPIADDRGIALAVRFVLATPDLFLNTASDVTLLEKILAAADRGGPAPTEEEMAELARERGMAPLFVS